MEILEKKFEPLLSVIIPVFNTKEYLEQCFNSLLSQTLHNIEIVVIDDSSTDGSSDVCDEYAVRDQRFRVFHKRSNEGLAAARNDGVKNSLSEFIMFVDSDDWVEADFCETPYNIALKENADIVCFQYYRFDEYSETKKPPFPIDGIACKEDVLTEIWPYTYATSMNKLYRKSLFTDISYPIGRYSEDIAVSYKLIYKARRIYLQNSWLYHYRTDRPGSICNTASIKHSSDHMFFTFKMLQDMERWGLDCEKEKISFAISYLITFGRDAELSENCCRILNDGKADRLSWKMKILLRLYRSLPIIFTALTKKRFMRMIMPWIKREA